MDPELAEKIRNANRSVHEEEAAKYDILHTEVNNWYQRRQIGRDLRLIANLLPRPARRALDLGCGTGNILLPLGAAGFTACGVDISPAMVEEAARRWEERGLSGRPETVAEDVDQFLRRQGPGYHLISFGSVLHHLPDYLGTLRAAAARLETPGVLWITNEPLGRGSIREGLVSYRILYRVDRAWCRLAMMWRGVRPLARDAYDLSDFHRRRGTFDHQEIIGLLRDLGFEILQTRFFSMRKTGLGSWIDSKLLGSANAFSLIAGRGCFGHGPDQSRDRRCR